MQRVLMRFFLGVYVFLFIYNPTNFLSFNLIYLLFLVALPSVLINTANGFSLFRNKRVFSYILFLFYIIFYLIILGEDAYYTAYSYLLVLLSLICSQFIVTQYSRLYPTTFNSFLGFLSSIGLVQLLFVTTSIVSPTFREWTLETSRMSDLLSISNNYGGLRSYGLANGYTSTFPMLMGVYALIFIVMASRTSVLNLKFNWLLLFSCLFVSSVVLNARIGLIPIIIYFMLAIFSMFFHMKNFIKMSKLFLFLSLGILIFYLFSPDITKYTTRLAWGIDELVSLIHGKKVGTFYVLEEMFHFPQNAANLFFGTGFSVFGEQDNFPVSSDIGFIRDTYMFGAINVALLLSVVIYLTTPLRAYLIKYLGPIFVYSLFIALFFYYFKGALWASSEIYNFIVLLSLFSIYLSSNFIKYEKNTYH